MPPLTHKVAKEIELSSIHQILIESPWFVRCTSAACYTSDTLRLGDMNDIRVCDSCVSCGHEDKEDV